jgi:hypothetical protein
MSYYNFVIKPSLPSPRHSARCYSSREICAIFANRMIPSTWKSNLRSTIDLVSASHNDRYAAFLEHCVKNVAFDA